MEAFLFLGSVMIAAHVMMSSSVSGTYAIRSPRGKRWLMMRLLWPSLTNTHDDDKAKCVVAVTRAKKDRKEKAVWVVPWWPAAAKAGAAGRVMKRRQPTVVTAVSGGSNGLVSECLFLLSPASSS